MAFEAGLPLHLVGVACALGSNFIIPTGIPLTIEGALLTSNPGAIDAAHNHWLDAAKKLDEFKAVLEKAKKLDPEYWTGDDRTAFEHAVEKYENELQILRDGLNGAATVLEALAIAFFALCLLVLAVGTVMLGLAILAYTFAVVPIIGEAVVAECNALVASMTAMLTPHFGTFKLGLATTAGILTAVVAATGGKYEFKQLTGGKGDPNFIQVVAPVLSNP